MGNRLKFRYLSKDVNKKRGRNRGREHAVGLVCLSMRIGIGKSVPPISRLREEVLRHQTCENLLPRKAAIGCRRESVPQTDTGRQGENPKVFE